MNCYCCIEQGIHFPAVAICRSCGAGLCLDHLQETASRLAPNVLASCHHDTWTATELQSGPPAPAVAKAAVDTNGQRAVRS